jgi:hypothetical protein
MFTSQKSHFLLGVQTIVLSVAALYFGRPVLMPLVLSILLTFLLRPAVLGLERRRMPRVAAVGFVVAMILVLIGMVGWTLTQQFHQLALNLDDYQGHMRTRIEALHSRRIAAFDNVRALVREVSDATEGESQSPSEEQRGPDASPDSDHLDSMPDSVPLRNPGRDPGTKQEPEVVRVVSASPGPAETARIAWDTLSRNATSPMASPF